MGISHVTRYNRDSALYRAHVVSIAGKGHRVRFRFVVDYGNF